MWPVSVTLSTPEARSHTLIVRSAAPVTNHSLAGSTASDRTQPRCPLMTRISRQGACQAGTGTLAGCRRASATNRCDLGWYDRYATVINPTLAQIESIVPQVIEMQAQYGVAPVGTQTVDTWVDASGGTWAAPTFTNALRVKAIRIALITRGSREPTQVSPATLTLWPGTTRTLTSAERYYRYQVLSAVIPLINVIWAGV